MYDYRGKLIQEDYYNTYSDLINEIKIEYKGLRRDEFIAIYAQPWLAIALWSMILEEFDDVYNGYEDDNDVQIDFGTLLLEDSLLVTICNDGCMYIEEARAIKGKIKKPEGAVLVYYHDMLPYQDLCSIRDNSIMVFAIEEDEYEEDCILNKIKSNDLDFKDIYNVK